MAVGKSTLVDTFLRPYRMKEMDRIGEKTWKVKEKEEELLVCENKVTEAKKELERLREKKEYSQCETKSKDIEALEKSMTALQEDISRLKLIDGENRAKLEALRKNIAKLTRDEDEMSRNRNFTEAQKIKEQLEEKVPCNHHYPAAALPSCCTAPPPRTVCTQEKEKRELTKQLQTQVKREDTPDATPDAVPVLGRKTVQIEEKEKFTIHHKVGDEPPVKLKVTLIDTPGCTPLAVPTRPLAACHA